MVKKQYIAEQYEKTADLMEKAITGLKSLDIQEKYINSALKELQIWFTDDVFKEYVPQITYLIESRKWDFLLDSFYQVIPFGTGGRRGLVGIGPNRINIWTIQASAQGHSQYLLNQYGDDAKNRGVVLTYDVRNYSQKGIYDDKLPNPVMNLDCKQLAIAAAEVYTANGINVFMFDGVRSTPELSFAIRYLNAAAGDMFSASHNPPTDNGKKVYDESGGQLIPPYDQELVDEVTGKTKEIKTLDFNEAKKRGLVRFVGEEVDNAYIDTVCSVSLSGERGLKILYSPLHGCGITSLYPVLKKLNFDITPDPKTANLSGAFENVTFNIPNPEIVESFDSSFAAAEKIDADIIINTDPDADRIGVMTKHKNSWIFLNGNEIGIILAQYGISKYKLLNLANKDNIIIKTVVTTSLIRKIAQKNGVRCIADLLVGFKYIAHEMNKLEKENGMKNFILGAEESHGFIIGNYARDKDAACAAIWISELAAELKKENRTLVDYLDEIYSIYGYCHNYLTEIRSMGAKGMQQIARIMHHLRSNTIDSFGKFTVNEKIDRWSGEPQPHLSPTDTASRDVLIFNFDNLPGTQSVKVTVRPSGTEPKVKMYFEVFGKPVDLKDLNDEKEHITGIREDLEKNLMLYCYKILGIDFPVRGFLLFWQLPLDDKLKYFQIEDEISGLKGIPGKASRKEALYKLLEFLGANPVEKVDKAFAAKYRKGMLEYLDLES